MAEKSGRSGILFPNVGVRAHLEMARYADQKGVDSLWVIETRLTWDGISPLAAYGTVTDRIRLGTGIIPMWSRNPALIAQTFATLDANAPGRIVMGLGAWWEPLATRVGVKREKPIRAMREVVEAVRLLLSMKEHVTYHGQHVHLDDVYLDHDATGPHDVKVYIGAVGPQMLRLAGRIADGVILNAIHTVESTRREVEQVRKGAESVGRSLDDVDVVQPVRVSLTRNKKEVLQEDKLFIAQYIAQQPHIEGPSMVEPELAQRLKSIITWPANQQQLTEGARLLSDGLAESVGCYGDEEEVRSRLREYAAAGVNVSIAYSDISREFIDFVAKGW